MSLDEVRNKVPKLHRMVRARTWMDDAGSVIAFAAFGAAIFLPHSEIWISVGVIAIGWASLFYPIFSGHRGMP